MTAEVRLEGGGLAVPGVGCCGRCVHVDRWSIERPVLKPRAHGAEDRDKEDYGVTSNSKTLDRTVPFQKLNSATPFMSTLPTIAPFPSNHAEIRYRPGVSFNPNSFVASLQYSSSETAKAYVAPTRSATVKSSTSTLLLPRSSRRAETPACRWYVRCDTKVGTPPPANSTRPRAPRRRSVSSPSRSL